MMRAGIGPFGEVAQFKKTLKVRLFKRDFTEKVIDKIVDTLSVLDIVTDGSIDSYEYAGRTHISAFDLKDQNGKRYTLFDDDLRDLMAGREACLYLN